MPRDHALRRTLVVLLLCTLAGSGAAQTEQEKFTNLKVLPSDIAPGKLRATMNGFTRALGVRCIYCHVGQEGRPFRHEEFALDDKPTKAKARAMIKMVQDINDKYLASIDHPAEPPLHVECFTCHHGVPLPRALQDVLQSSYDLGGIDSTLTRYRALRDRYYGRAAYDFGEVPLTLVAAHAESTGHADDAVRLLTLDVEMNPASEFARRQHASTALATEFRARGADAGAAAYRDLKARYGETIVSEALLNQVGYQLLGAGAVEPALAVFRLIVTEHPASANAYDSMGEAYLAHGDRRLAREAYSKSLELDPKNDNARQKLVDLKASTGSKGSGKGTNK